MTFLGATGLINFVACATLALLVLRRAPKAQEKGARAYGIFNIAIALYNLFYFFWQESADVAHAGLWFKLLFLGIVWINQGYLYFIFNFLGIEEKQRTVLRSCAIINVAFSAANIMGILYSNLEPRFGIGFWPVPTAWFSLYLIFWHIECLYGFIQLLIVYRATQGQQKEQLKYMAVALSVGYFGGATNWPMWYSIHFPPYFNGLIAAYDAIVAYAIVRHRLMDINLIIRKTITYSIVTGTLTIVYLGSITLFARLFEGFAGRQTVFSAALAAALITLFFQPLRRRVQAFIDSKFFRQYVDREEKLYELSREVVTHTTTEAMGDALTRVLAETLHPKSGALFLRSKNGSGFDQVAGFGDSSLPSNMVQDNELANYFRDHPQPFVHDMPSDTGRSWSTRHKDDRGEAA